MSRPAKLTLAASVIVSGLTVWGVHYMQEKEREVMYRGVERDEARQAEKRKRQLELQINQEKEAAYQKIQPTAGTALSTEMKPTKSFSTASVGNNNNALDFDDADFVAVAVAVAAAASASPPAVLVPRLAPPVPAIVDNNAVLGAPAAAAVAAGGGGARGFFGRLNLRRPPIPLDYRSDRSDTDSSFSDSVESLESYSSLHAILDGVRGGRWEAMHSVPTVFFPSQSTLDSLDPFVSESVLGAGDREGDGEVLEPETPGAFTRAFASLIGMVNRVNPFTTTNTNNKMGGQGRGSVGLDSSFSDSESEFVSFDVLLAVAAAANNNTDTPFPPPPPSPIKLKPPPERSPLYNVFPSVTSGLNLLDSQSQPQPQPQPDRRHGLTPEILRRFFKDLPDDDDDDDEEGDEIANEIETLFKNSSKWF